MTLRAAQHADEAAEGRYLSVGVRQAVAARLIGSTEGRRTAPAVLPSTITYGLRRLSARRWTQEGDVKQVPISLNATFAGSATPDPEFDHPEGASIAKLLSLALRSDGWTVCDFENWRDVGWSLACSKGVARLECAIAQFGPKAWMLQVAPASIPGLLGRLFGRQPTASQRDVLELSRNAHRALAESFHQFRWRWDGPPTETSSIEPDDPA